MANYLRETVDLVKQIETRFLELAARLYKINAQHLWKDEHDTFSEFLDSAGLKRNFASMLMAVHEAYVINAQIQAPELIQAGYSKLYDAIPLLSHEDPKLVVAKAKLLSQSELRENIREKKYGECSHSETIKICASCHKRV